MRKYAVEFIGTLFLVFVVSAAGRTGTELAPIAIGATLMVMVYAGGHISGGHYNPAVTLAVLIRGKIAKTDAIGYWLVQVVGGIAGAWIARGIVSVAHSGPPLKAGGAAFVAEVLFTFALAYVVLNVATSKDHPDNSFYGLAIGFTVAAGAVAVGGVSGGAFNPAVAIGVTSIGLFSWSSIWIYLIANLGGAAVAAFAFLMLNSDDGRKSSPTVQTNDTADDDHTYRPVA